jgi:S-(hydroxymethyl)glutathione dehydrogenase / alcohol dehydrogenase
MKAKAAVVCETSRSDPPGYIDCYMSGEIEIDSLVTHIMPLKDINRAFDLMHSGESTRSVIIF